MAQHRRAALLMALWFFAGGAAAEAHVSIEIDVEPARAVLAALQGRPDRIGEESARVAAMPAIRAMIAKEHKYNDKAGEESFRAALASVARGGADATFQLETARKDAATIGAMLQELESRKDVLERQLNDRLQSFAPADLDLQARLVVVLGSHQNGWVPDQKTPIFYLDAVFQHGDLHGLMATAAHELFHVVQGAVQPDWSAAFTAIPKESANAQAMHNVHAALLNLVIEGMADYVGDPNAFGGTGPGITEARNEYSRNLGRIGECFALFDTLMLRLARDPAAPLGSLLDIGFGGAWDQTGYYVGYRMAGAIDRHLGRKRLQELVRLTPEDFVADYIKVARDHADDPDIVPLAASTIAAVEASQREQHGAAE